MNCGNDVIEADLDYICANLRDDFAQMAGKNLLITGGAGFLGYYFIQSVLHWNRTDGDAPGVRVTVYDNFMRGIPDWLANLENEPDLNIVRHDVNDPLPENATDFEYIIHGASIASPIYYRRHPVETMDANVNGFRRLLDYCRKAGNRGFGVEGILFFSSSEIYGDPSPDNIPTPETYRGNVSCTGPRACYDESKRYGETLAVNFAQQYDVPVKTARPFNNYGPGLKITDRRALPDFARDVLNNRDIVLLSDGLPTRTFCYVADAIVGYYRILTRGRSGEAYNIGVDGPEISVRELAESVIRVSSELFDYRGMLVNEKSPDKDYLVDNPNRRCPDITKARSELGYMPEITIEDGLKRSLLWYADNNVGDDA